MNPANYKTQSGLINGLTRKSEQSMDVKSAWWFAQAQWSLVNKWGWTEEQAAKFVAAYHPTTSVYRASV